MATMDIFEGDAFSIIELTRALENIPFKPAILSGASLFGSRGVRSRTVMIESRDGTLSLIPFSERGSAYEQQVPERRDMRAFVCRQFKKQDVLWASEIQGIRDFGSETATQQVQTEVARKMARLRNDAEATFEFHLFNGIQGVVKDPQRRGHGASITTPSSASRRLQRSILISTMPAAGSGALRKRCQAMIESVEDSLGGLAAGQCSCAPNAARPSLPIWSPTRRCARPISTPPPRPICVAAWAKRSALAASLPPLSGGLGFGVPTDKAYFYPRASRGSSRSTTRLRTPSRR